MGKPGHILCIDAPVVPPNFATFADSAFVASKCLLDGFLICRSLNFVDAKNVASVIHKEEAKSYHVPIAADACPKTLIWVNSVKHRGRGCATRRATRAIHAVRSVRIQPKSDTLRSALVERTLYPGPSHVQHYENCKALLLLACSKLLQSSKGPQP